MSEQVQRERVCSTGLASRVGAFLRKRREYLGLTIDDVGRDALIHPSNVARYERGDGCTSLDRYQRMAKALGFRLFEVIRHAERE